MASIKSPKSEQPGLRSWFESMYLIIEWLAWGVEILLLFLSTFPYYLQLRQHTIGPMTKVMICSQSNDEDLVKQLRFFKASKEEELRHVKIAGTIVAAATIGVFQWPHAGDTFWLAQGLWYAAIVLWFFILVSSTHQRLLSAFPDLHGSSVSPMDIDVALKLVLWQPPQPLKAARWNWRNSGMAYLWQNTMMQMSWSCVMFVVGLTLHILRVYIPEHARNPGNSDNAQKKTAIVFVIFGSLAALNFFICTSFMERRVEDAWALPKQESV